MFAYGVRIARERSFQEDRCETEMAEMEENGHTLIVKIILQNGT